MPKKSQNEVPNVVAQVPFSAPKPGLQKNLYEMTPRLILGLDLGPILALSGSIFGVF
jgi:hypothetical protein